MITCENCGRAIGKLETAHVHNDHTVCGECKHRLAPAAADSSSLKPHPEHRLALSAWVAAALLVIGSITLLYAFRPAIPVEVDDFLRDLRVEDDRSTTFKKTSRWHGKRVRVMVMEARDVIASRGVNVTFNSLTSITDSPISLYYTCEFPDDQLSKIKLVQGWTHAYVEGTVETISLSWDETDQQMRVVWVNLTRCRFVD